MGKTEDHEMHHRMTKGLQSGIRRKKSLQDTKHTKSHQELFKIKGHNGDAIQTSSEVTSSHMHRIPRPAWSKARMYIVDSGASLHMKGLSSPMALCSQTRKHRCGSRSSALVSGYTWWKIDHPRDRWEDNAMSLVVLIRGRQKKLPDYQMVRK